MTNEVETYTDYSSSGTHIEDGSANKRLTVCFSFLDVPKKPINGVSGPGVRLAAIIYYDKYLGNAGNKEVLLPIVADGAREIQELLEKDFKYQILSEDPNPRVHQDLNEKLMQNESHLLRTFEMRLSKWKEKVEMGTIVDSFLIYYHGHGTEVLKNPCLLTSKWTAIPIDELVNLVTKVVNPTHYCLVLDCCSNYKADAKAMERLTKATIKRAKDFADRVVTVSAAPSGHTATAVKGKTLSSALVTVLKQSLDQEGRGVPLQELQQRLRQEQKNKESENLPMVQLPQTLSGRFFPF